MTRLIDLSQPIFEGMKVYPGHLKTVTFQHATHDETGPTHVDSFSHLDPDPAVPFRAGGSQDPKREVEILVGYR